MQKMLDELERLAQVGNDTLRPGFGRCWAARRGSRSWPASRPRHHDLPAVDEDYRRFLCAELDAWRESRPGVVRFLRSLDHAAAIARPAITVLLFVSGWHVAGDMAGQAAAHAAGVTVGQLAQEAAIAGSITGGGEAIVSGTSEGVRQAAGRLFVPPPVAVCPAAGQVVGRLAGTRSCWAISSPNSAAAPKCRGRSRFAPSRSRCENSQGILRPKTGRPQFFI